MFLFWYANCWLQYLYLVSYYLLFIFTCHISIFVLFFFTSLTKAKPNAQEIEIHTIWMNNGQFLTRPFYDVRSDFGCFLGKLSDKKNRSQHGQNRMQKGMKWKFTHFVLITASFWPDPYCMTFFNDVRSDFGSFFWRRDGVKNRSQFGQNLLNWDG